MSATTEAQIYQRIGEFVVSFQWIENRIREIGWFAQDPHRSNWPPPGLRSENSQDLFGKVEALLLGALASCDLDGKLEADFRSEIGRAAGLYHNLRRARNKIIHSAFVELKAGGEVAGIVRSNPKLERDPESGEFLFDQEMLSGSSFDEEIRQMGELTIILNRCYMQLIHRFPQGAGARPNNSLERSRER